MRRYSVLTALATAEFFGYHAVPTAPVSPTATNITNQIPGPVPALGARIIDYNSPTVVGINSAPIVALPNSTVAPVAPVGLAQSPGVNINGAVANVLTTGVALSSVPSIALNGTAAVNNTIPEEAAGGLGKYLNQIAAELSAELTARTDTNTTTTAPTQAAGNQAVPPPSLRNGFTYRTVAMAEAPMAAMAAAPSALPVASYPVIGTPNATGTTTAGNGGSTEYMTPERRSAESTLSTAAAAGGVLVLGAGACGLYAKNRRGSQAELSRFGSPYRRGGNEPPRRFVPV